MALAATKDCFASAGSSEPKPDLIISGSYTPSDLIGTIAHRLQRALNLPNARAIYLSTACSSMLNAIEVAEGYFASGKSSSCLVTASEHNSLYNDDSDPSSGPLWGDGAGAFLLSPNRPASGRGLQILSLITRAHAIDGHGPDAIYLRPRDGGLKMPHGPEVFRQAVAKMTATAEEALAAAGLKASDIRYLVPHQANQRITDAVAEKLGFESERVASVIERYGNTGCASVVLAFAEVDGELQNGEHALLVTFGGGYSSAAMVVRAESATTAPGQRHTGQSGHELVPTNSSNGHRALDIEKAFIEALVLKGGPDPEDYTALNNWFVQVHDRAERGELSVSDLLTLREAFGSSVSLDTLQGLVCQQPHGYPGDFEIIDRMYVGHLSAKPELMRWDAYFHSQVSVKAVRNRKEYFHQSLDRHYARQQPLSVLNLASGPGRCVFDWLSSRRAKQAYFQCVDLDPDAVTYARLLNRDFISQVSFERRNVLRFQPVQRYDLIWAAGLFDYFSDRAFEFVLCRLKQAIAPNGELIIGNFTSCKRARAYMEFGGWKLYTRNADALIALARNCGADRDSIRIGSEPQGVNLFLHIAGPQDNDV